MKEFKSHTIHHIDICEIEEMPLPAFPSLCHIWWESIPLGHLWIDANIAGKIEFKTKIAEQISAGIGYYVAQSGAKNIDNWKDLFLSGAINKLEALFVQILSPQELSWQKEIGQPISIVICTRNRAEHLDHCIKAILANSDTDFELIVVDNASDDDSTRRIAANYKDVRYISEPRKGLDIARNTGAQNAQYNIIAYTDDDVVVDREWVSKLKKCFTDHTVMSVTGQVFPVALNTKSQYIFERYWGFNKGYVPYTFDHNYFMAKVDYGVPVWDIGAGANMAFRREVFDLVGWFDERLDVGAAGCSGDSEFWYRILAEGWNCYYCPQMYVYHNHRENEEALNNQVFNYIRGQVASLMVQYERYGHKGNLLRVKKSLQQYYLKRLAKRIFKGNNDRESTLMTEIKGYQAGKKYYKSAKNLAPYQLKAYNKHLIKAGEITGTPLVSVIVTCYNYGQYLKTCLESILSQTYPNIEQILINDGSTDNSLAIAKEFPSVQIHTTQRVGVSAARNIGVQLSKGEFVVFVDADDYLYPNAVELNLWWFKAYPHCAFISGGHNKVHQNGKWLESCNGFMRLEHNYLTLLQNNYIGFPATVMFRRELFFTYHFDTQLPHCEDYDLTLNIAKYLPTVTHDKPIAAYRQHGANKSANKAKMLETIKIILNKHLEKAENDEIREAIDQGIENWTNYYQNI